MATTLSAECPQCGAKYKLKDASAAGKKMKCRACEKVFVVPKPQSAAEDEWGDDDFSGLDEDFGDEAPAKLPTKKKSARKPKAEKAAKPKKERKAAAGPRRGISPGLIGAAVVMLLVLAGGGWFLLRGGPEPIKPPASFVEFQHPEQVFRCERPDGWTENAGGQRGSVLHARFEQGDAQIRIRSSMGGSAIGDIAKSFSNPNSDDPMEKPVAQVHMVQQESYADDYSGYSEQTPQFVQTKMGEAARSEFTAKEGWGTKIRGYRATLLGSQYQLNVICKCRESDWAVCQPVFDRVIASLSN